jgi:hypothetical protein
LRQKGAWQKADVIVRQRRQAEIEKLVEHGDGHAHLEALAGRTEALTPRLLHDRQRFNVEEQGC